MKMLLKGEWVDREKTIEVRDPYDNSVIDTVPSASKEDIETALDAAVLGYEEAKRMTVYERAQVLFKAASIVSENLEKFARIIAREGSKTIREARKEASRCVNTLTVSAEEAKRILGETIPFDSFPGGEKRRGYYYRFPIGVVLAITPFNDPLNLVAHKLGPAIAAGNHPLQERQYSNMGNPGTGCGQRYGGPARLFNADNQGFLSPENQPG